MKRDVLAIIISAMLVQCLCLHAAEGHYVRTYSLTWARAAELTEVVSELLGTEGRVFKYNAGNELIVSTTSNLHDQVASLISDIDVATPNVRIDVVMGEKGRSHDSGVDISGSAKVRVSQQGSSTRFKFSPKARNRSTTESSITSQSLLIQSGREGKMHIGEDIPYAEWLFYYGKSHGYINWDFTFEPESIGALLVAKPQVMGKGPYVTITLVPELRTLVGKKYRHFQFTKVATTVIAEDGKTISIGGASQHREFYDKFLVGYSNSGKAAYIDITLTPHIMFPGKTKHQHEKRKVTENK